MQLKLLPNTFGILKFEPPQTFPVWLGQAEIFFVAQTEDEYSIICPQQHIPANIEYSKNWRCFRADGDLEFDEIGVVAKLSKPLADAGMSIFLVSTHDRDYVFVQDDDLQKAIDIYTAINFSVNV